MRNPVLSHAPLFAVNSKISCQESQRKFYYFTMWSSLTYKSLTEAKICKVSLAYNKWGKREKKKRSRGKGKKEEDKWGK